MADYDAVVVGAGLAGLTCALTLQQEGWKVKVYEMADKVGGRVWSDREDGFIFDRGFQVLHTAYPDCQQWLDYDLLQLGAFQPGAIIQWRGNAHTLYDPWREPGGLIKSLLNPIGTLKDKYLLYQFRKDLLNTPLRDLYFRENLTAYARLKQLGFSRRMVEQFFRPFFGGVFLESELETSRRILEFLFKMFIEGDATLPADGMNAIPEQLASRLEPGTLETGVEVYEIEPRRLELAHGQRVTAESIAIAVPFSAIGTLVKGMVFPKRNWHGTTNLYYEAPESPFNQKKIFLNAEPERTMINNLCVPSDVQPSYAPEGKSLVSVSTVGAYDIKEAREQGEKELGAWFPEQFPEWRFIKGYKIDRALPRQNPFDVEPIERIEALEPGFYMCGDHRQTSSIQGAMSSGRRAAEAMIKERKLTAD